MYQLDLGGHHFMVNGVEVPLTRIEWGITEVLIRNTGTLVKYRDLINEVWGPEYPWVDNYRLHWHVLHLRKKIAKVSGGGKSPIKTIRQFGYIWRPSCPSNTSPPVRKPTLSES